MSIQPLTENDLRWLVCPVCRQRLQLDGHAIVCLGCGRRYPILDGIPVLLKRPRDVKPKNDETSHPPFS